MTNVPEIARNWAQRAFEGDIIEHDGHFYRAGDTYSYGYTAPILPGATATMDVMLMATVRRVEEVDPARVREVDVAFYRPGIEGTRKVYRLVDDDS